MADGEVKVWDGGRAYRRIGVLASRGLGAFEGEYEDEIGRGGVRSACVLGVTPSFYGGWDSSRVAFCAGSELPVDVLMEVHA